MANDYIETTAGSGGPKLDTRKVTVGANTNLHRQSVVITNASDESTADVLPVAADNAAADYGLPVRLIGNVAHDAVDIGSPVKIGGYAAIAQPSAVAAADRVNAWWLLNGQLVVAETPFYGAVFIASDGPRFPQRTVVSAALNNSAADLTAAAGALLYTYVTSITISASATSSTNPVQIRRTTGSTVVWSAYLLGGTPIHVNAPDGRVLCSSAVNDKLELFTAANITVVANVTYFISSNSAL